jgi:purine-nucleoside phosphorylase
MIKGGEHLNRLSERGNELRPAWRKAAEELREKIGRELPRAALILGSGFQKMLDGFEVEAEVELGSVPGYPAIRVKGHSARLLVVNIEGLRLAVLSGRAHFYEGHPMDAVMFPVRMLGECGVTELLLTNAAGGINAAYEPGDFMLLADHINFMGVNPLRGLPVEDGRCFVDLSDTYNEDLRRTFRQAALETDVTLHEGVYVAVSGPLTRRRRRFAPSEL